MTTTARPTEIAIRFIDAWAAHDMAAVTSMLADEVRFESPRMAVEGIDAVVSVLNEFSRIVTGVNVIAVLGDEDQAMIMYDLIIGPFGTLRVVDRLLVADGKITDDSIVFDTYELRVAEAARGQSISGSSC